MMQCDLIVLHPYPIQPLTRLRILNVSDAL